MCNSELGVGYRSAFSQAALAAVQSQAGHSAVSARVFCLICPKPHFTQGNKRNRWPILLCSDAKGDAWTYILNRSVKKTGNRGTRKFWEAVRSPDRH